MSEQPRIESVQRGQGPLIRHALTPEQRVEKMMSKGDEENEEEEKKNSEERRVQFFQLRPDM